MLCKVMQFYVCIYLCMYVCMYCMYVYPVWFGMVWYGPVWFAMVWYGMYVRMYVMLCM